jgi:hypothetical protein
MAARSTNRVVRPRTPSAYINWLEQLDKRIRKLSAGSDWQEELGPHRCRRFIMVRFPELERPLPEQVFASELLRGERLIDKSKHADRILRGLNVAQRSQLAGLLLDIAEGLDMYNPRRVSSKEARKLGAEWERRTRMLSRKVSSIRRKLEGLRDYASDLHPLLGLEYIRAAKRCLETLAKLKEDSSDGEFYRLFESEHPTLQDPRHLGIVELYWFFRHECGCTGRESEVRVAVLANEFLACNLAYIPKYNDAESQGCPAVRQAVLRCSPHTTN